MTNIENVLKEWANKVAYGYKEKLQEARASGKLIDSISTKVEGTEGNYEVILSLEDYWKYIEYGRNPGGKFPPSDIIREWIKVKPIHPYEVSGRLPSEKSLVYLISRKIARDGIEGKHFLSDTIEDLYGELESTLAIAMEKDVRNILIQNLITK